MQKPTAPLPTSGVEPFRIDVPEAVLIDLRERLARVRWPDEPPGAGWNYGTDLAYLENLVAYWRDGYDWRAREARLDRFPQFRTRQGDALVHFIHQLGEGQSPCPLLLSHGWPGSIVEFGELIPRLTRPSAYGHDWGAFISTRLGYAHAERLLGVHLTLLATPREPVPCASTPEEQRFNAQLAHWQREETGYSHLMATKPQTLAYGLTDSPVGLAAWIVEKFRTWSDCGGELEAVFSRDTLIDNVMLYWVTGAIGSSFWPYYARHHGPWFVPPGEKVRVPTGYAEFPKEILSPPRSLAATVYADLRRWTPMARGGHFAALEEPDALAHEIREFFRPLRAADRDSGEKGVRRG
jgi:pimeloyl-ACP methyl ester carboxylesterase